MAIELDSAMFLEWFYQQMYKILIGLISCLIFSCNSSNQLTNIKVNLEYSETPHLEKWGKDAKLLLEEWVPKTAKILNIENYPQEINLVLQNTDEGIAYADSNKIVVSSHWIEKYPEDIGLIVHEGVHVVQLYPNFNPGWLTEGIADYIRWHLYEEKPIEWFPMSENKNGWEDAYQVTGGFLLYLMKEFNPDIVRILNSAMKTDSYSDSTFNENIGKKLPDLWENYTLFKANLSK